MRREEGVTLVEVIVSLAVLTLFASVTYWALLQLNTQAAVARLHTGAQAALQNQIDNFQTLSVSALSGASWAGTFTVPIYTDPQALVGGTMKQSTVVTGTLTMLLTGTGTTPSPGYFNYYTATASVTYSYPPNRPITYSGTMVSTRTDAP